VRVRNGGVRNQTSSEQDVSCGRNVVAGFVPKIGQWQQRQMQQKNENKYCREHQGRVIARQAHERAPVSSVITQKYLLLLACMKLAPACQQGDHLETNFGIAVGFEIESRTRF